jgi:hypothetical protein
MLDVLNPFSAPSKPRASPIQVAVTTPTAVIATVGTSSDHSAALRRGTGSALASCEMTAAPMGSRHALINP